MTKKRKAVEITLESKISFINENIKVCGKAFESGTFDNIVAKVLVGRARDHFGYSEKTNDVDIWSSLRTAWRTRE